MGLTQVEKEGIETLINNNADNRVITGSGTANTLEGEANLTFNGSELLLGTTTAGESGADDLTIENTSADMGITLRSGTSNNGNLFFADGTSGAAQYAGYLQYSHADNKLSIGTNGTNKVQVLSNGNLNISDGDLVIGTSGHGIDFSATANTGTSELFADYEEGAWSINPHDGTCTTTSGKYRLIGQQVTVWAKASGFSDTSTNDMIKLKGLPYATSSSWAGAAGACMAQEVSENAAWIAFAEDDHIKFYAGSTGTFAQLRHNELDSGHEIYFCATYPIG